MALTDKQQQFILEYLVDFNGTQAAIRAGYAKSGAHTEAYRLLRDAEIARRIAELGQQTADELGMTRAYVLSRLKDVIDRSIEGAQKVNSKGEPVFDADGKPVIEWSPSGAKGGLELLAKIRRS